MWGNVRGGASPPHNGRPSGTRRWAERCTLCSSCLWKALGPPLLTSSAGRRQTHTWLLKLEATNVVFTNFKAACVGKIWHTQRRLMERLPVTCRLDFMHMLFLGYSIDESETNQYSREVKTKIETDNRSQKRGKLGRRGRFLPSAPLTQKPTW